MKDRTYQKKYFLGLAASAVPFLLGFVWLVRAPQFALLVFLAVYALVAWLWWRRWTSRHKCPQCGRMIKHPTVSRPEEGDPVNFYCEHCDIEWETGFTTTYED